MYIYGKPVIAAPSSCSNSAATDKQKNRPFYLLLTVAFLWA